MRETSFHPILLQCGRCDPARMRENWDKYLPSEEVKAKINRECLVSFSRLDGGDRSTIKMLFISYFLSVPESEPESESIRIPES